MTQRILESNSTGNAHFDADGRPACGAKGDVTGRTVADADKFVTCAKCRKAKKLPFAKGGFGGPKTVFAGSGWGAGRP